jgi:hypothetical protein
MQTIEISHDVGNVTLHIPDAWTTFQYRGQWYVKDDATELFVKVKSQRDDHLERSNGTSAPLKPKD